MHSLLLIVVSLLVSGRRAICDSPRNVPDDVLARMPANGGVVMVNFFNGYVSCANSSNISQVVDHIDHIVKIASIQNVGYGSDFDGVSHELPQVSNIALHAFLTDIRCCHFRSIQNLTDVSMFPNLTAELLRRGTGIPFFMIVNASHELLFGLPVGYKDDDVIAIIGGNVLRAFQKAEQVAANLQASLPDESRIFPNSSCRSNY